MESGTPSGRGGLSAPVVEVGATVRVRAEDGKTSVWTIVSGRSSPKDGRISRETALGAALLGRRVGEKVAVLARTAQHYTIEHVQPAPVPRVDPPTTASRQAARPPATTEIMIFGPGQEADYEDWVHLNSGGYVLKQRDTVEEGYMLHLATCSHLELTPGAFTMRTANPRHCSRSPQALVQRALEESGRPPQRCSSCF
jgi:hypothetical protein